MMVLKILGGDHGHCQNLGSRAFCSAIILEAIRSQQVVNDAIGRYNVRVVRVVSSLLGSVVTPF
jgi:hypothetical protein